MKKLTKIIALFLVLTSILTLVGCNETELGFLTALKKTQTMTSYNCSSEFSTVMTCNVPESFKQTVNIQSVLNALSSFKVKTEEATINDNNGLKSKISYSVASDDMSFKSNMYISMDDKNIIETFEIPSIAKAFLPAQNENAKFITLDFNEYIKVLEELVPTYGGMASNNLLSKSYKLSTAYSTFNSEYAKLVKGTPEFISKKGNVYSIKLNDASFKLLLKCIANTYMDDNSARELTDVFVKDILDFYEEIMPQDQYMQIEMALINAININPDDLENNKSAINSFFDVLNQIPILGDKGISINCVVDNKGYISKVDGYIDFIVDVKAISAATGNSMYSEDFNFEFLVNFKQEYKDINAAKKIEMPVLTKENNVSYSEIMKNLLDANKIEQNEYQQLSPKVELPAKDGSISIMFYGEKIDFGKKQPQMVNDVLYVPFEELVSFFGYDYYWDFNENCALFGECNDMSKWAKFKPQDNKIYFDDYMISLSNNIITIDGDIYVPLRTFAKAGLGGYSIKWNEQQNAAHIRY